MIQSRSDYRAKSARRFLLPLLFFILLLPSCSQDPACPDIIITGNNSDDDSALRMMIPTGATFFSAYCEGENGDPATPVTIDASATGHTRVVIARIDYDLYLSDAEIRFLDDNEEFTVSRYPLPGDSGRRSGSIVLTYPIEGNRPGGGLSYPFGTGSGNAWKFVLDGDYDPLSVWGKVTIFGYTYNP